MKSIHLVSVSLLLSTGLLACSPQGVTPKLPNHSQQAVLSDVEIEAQVQAFELSIFTENASGARNPLSPDQLEYLQLDQHQLQAQQLTLPGISRHDSLGKTDSEQRKWLTTVAQGAPQIVFNGGGQYTVFMPASSENGVLSLKLRNQAEAYLFLRAADLNSANLILKPNAELLAELDAGEGFRLQQTDSAQSQSLRQRLRALFQSLSPAERRQARALTRRFLLHVKGEQSLLRLLDQTITRLELVAGQQPAFQPSKNPVAEEQSLLDSAEAEFSLLNQQLADPTHQLLLNFAGRWQPESDFLRALIPGNKLIVSLGFEGENSYQASAELAESSFNTQGSLPELALESRDSLTLQVKRGNQSIEVQLKVVNENRISLTLLQSVGASDLNPLLNNPIYLHRVL